MTELFNMKRLARGMCILMVCGSVAALSACDSAAEQEKKYINLGESLYQSGDYEKARLNFQNALQINPKSIGANFKLAETQEKLRNWRAAVGGYRRVVELDAKHLQAHLHLAQIYLMANIPGKAGEEVDTAKSINGDDSGVYTMEGALDARQGNVESAMMEAKKALQRDPKNIDAIMLLSSLYVRTKQPEEAIALLGTAMKAHPNDLSIHLVLADIYAGQNNAGEAVNQLKEIIRIDPKGLSHRLRLADYYIRLKKPDEAGKVMQQAVADLPDDSTAKLAMTKFIAKQKGKDEAEKALLGYINQSPDDYALRFGLASLYESYGELDKAKTAYRDIIKKDDMGAKGLEARTSLAKILIKQGQVADATSLLDAVLKENASDNNALILRGMISLSKKDADSAIADFRTVLRDQPNSAEITQLLAKANLLNGDVDLAKDQLKRAVSLKPKDPEVRLELAQVLATNKQDIDQGIEQVNVVLKQAPDSRGALEALYNMQAAKADWDGAEKTAMRIKKVLPDKAQGAYMLGLAYQNNKRFKDAIAQFDQALAINQDAPGPLAALVKTYMAEKRSDEAMKVIDKAIKHNPSDALAYNLKGELLLLDKQADKSMQAFHKAIEVNPKWGIPYRNLAGAYLSKNDIKGAVNAYHQGIDATGHSQRLVFDLAALYESRGNHDAAISQYEDALKRDPSSAESANNLAMMLVTYKQDKPSLEKARDLVKKLENSPNPAYQDTLGWVLYKNGDLDPAITVLEKAVKQAPNSKLLRYHLGMALFGAGRTTSAKENLQKALDGDVKFNGRDEAKATLEKIAGL